MSNRRTKKRKKDIVQKKIIGIHQQDTVLKELHNVNPYARTYKITGCRL